MKTKEQILEDLFYKPETQDWYKPVLKAMEIYAQQSNQQTVSRNKTPESIRVGKHIFSRHLMDNEYAEEMKCKCGFVIWSCQNEAEATKAIENLGGDINHCV